jgi:hypothetical protein
VRGEGARGAHRNSAGNTIRPVGHRTAGAGGTGAVEVVVHAQGGAVGGGQSGTGHAADPRRNLLSVDATVGRADRHAGSVVPAVGGALGTGAFEAIGPRTGPKDPQNKHEQAKGTYHHLI